METEAEFLHRKIRGLNHDEQTKLFLDLYQTVENKEEKRVETARPEIKKLGEFYDQAVENLRTPGKITGLPTGYARLDLLTGGFDPEELIILAGPSAHGKTLLAQNILHNLGAQGIPSLFISMEMSNPEVTGRFVEMQRTVGPAEDLKEYPIWYYAGRTAMDVDLVRATTERAIQDHGIRILCVDHLHYFPSSKSSRREDIDAVVQAHKNIAREFRIPVILISHTRRLESDTAEPQEVDLKESSGIIQIADQSIMVWRMKNSTDEAERRLLKYKVTKNRLKGRTGEGSMKIDKNWKLEEDNEDPLVKQARLVFKV